MITKEEFKNIQIGDQIKIVDRWNEYSGESQSGDMDYLLGKTLDVTERATKTTVARVGGTSVFIIRDDGCAYGWSLNLHCIEKVIKYTVKSIDDDSLEKMLEVNV